MLIILVGDQDQDGAVFHFISIKNRRWKYLNRDMLPDMLGQRYQNIDMYDKT